MVVKPGREYYGKPIRYKWGQRLWIKDYVKELLAKGIIQESNGKSNYVHPVVLVPEAQLGQQYRCCINYKPVNANTVPDNYPTPNVEDTLELLC